MSARPEKCVQASLKILRRDAPDRFPFGRLQNMQKSSKPSFERVSGFLSPLPHSVRPGGGRFPGRFFMLFGRGSEERKSIRRREVGERGGVAGRRGADPYRGKQALHCRRERGGRGGALLIHREAVPLLQQEKAKDADAVTVGNRERALRVIGAPTPTEENKNRRGYKYAFSGGRRWQPKADG